MGNLFIATGHQIVELTPQNSQTTFDTNFGFASALAVDAQGDVFVADSMNTAVIKVAPVLVTRARLRPAPAWLPVRRRAFSGRPKHSLRRSACRRGDAPDGGTVTFYDGSASIGQGMVSGGVATFTTAKLTVGTHSISASYGGTTGYTASASGIGAGAGQSLVRLSGLPIRPARLSTHGNLYISDFNQ